MSQKVSFTNSNDANITMSGVLYFPADFDEKEKYPAIAITHPGGGVKEQTAGLYAEKIAVHGFVTLAYDASYQGESTGEPRQLENPYTRTEDVSAAIDYLTTLSYVDADKIGAMGICAGGGYRANAAINDRRINAVAAISAVNIGSMFRNGWDNNYPDKAGLMLIQKGAEARTAQALGKEITIFPLAPMKKEDAPNDELAEAWEYYHTERCQYPTAPGYMTAKSLTQIIPYDAYNKAEVFFTQPLLTVVGNNAGSKWMSDDLMERVASGDKKMHIIKGANHMSLYDVPQYVDEAVAQIVPFFEKNISKSIIKTIVNKVMKAVAP